MHFSWHRSCRIYLCCFPLALANIGAWLLVQFFEISSKNSKSPTIPFGIVACTFSDNLSWNSCMYLVRCINMKFRCVWTRLDVHACGTMYICVISNCMDAVRYIYIYMYFQCIFLWFDVYMLNFVVYVYGFIILSVTERNWRFRLPLLGSCFVSIT